ncbi:acetate/propionate family kinase [Hyphomonas sp.]|uniref:acetate/propionate family kinase n=1 Tax=Hyphomonas sp. TaxID=87 RepID=UPI003918C108
MSRIRIATLNTGSSSIKMAAFEPGTGADEPGAPVLRAQISGLPSAPRLSVKAGDEAAAERFRGAADLSDLSAEVLALRLIAALEAALGGPVSAVGHRIVQGGPEITGSRRAATELLDLLDTLSPLAPDHQPHNLSAVRALMEARPGLLQTLSFDTAFHRTQPRIAQLYAIPRALSDEGMLRYGYHGLSYAHVARSLPRLFGARAHDRTLALHLGSGASLCALRGGLSVACSMGFSALSGIPMGTRSGDVDPGLILFLLRERSMSVEAVSQMLRQESGLLGVSGVSGDLRAVEASDTDEAREATDLFAYRIVRECGSMIAALGGLDALVFTAGIGENAPGIRARIAEGLAWTGLRLDAAANAGNALRIDGPESSVCVAVMPADEEWEIARGTLGLIEGIDSIPEQKRQD